MYAYCAVVVVPGCEHIIIIIIIFCVSVARVERNDDIETQR